MSPARAPALEVHVSLRAADGVVVERIRLCWARPPAAGDVLDALVRLAQRGRRGGTELWIERAPAELSALLGVTGLAGGPIHAGSGGEHVRQVEGGEQ